MGLGLGLGLGLANRDSNPNPNPNQGSFLLLTGPVMAAAITPNLMEQASIWCFFSIMQAR